MDVTSSCSSDSVVDDMLLLLECLKYQTNDVSSQKQALTTLSTMCTRSAEAKEQFRTEGCLDYVLKLVKTTDSYKLLQAGLCVLGCATENNVTTQMILSDKELFILLNNLLRSAETSLLVKSSVVFLIVNIINNNSQGQNLTYETKVLLKLIDLFKTNIPLNELNSEIVVDYWCNVAKAISAACDNPQNETNQNICSSIFPVAISLLHSTDHKVTLLRPTIIALTSCIANNKRGQDRLHMVGGLHTLIELLNTLLTNSIGSCDDNIVLVIQAIFAAASSNATNTNYLATVQLVPTLLNFLSNEEELDSYQLLSVITCLETLIESNDEHQKHFIESQGDTVLISIMMSHPMDESVSKAISMILRTCSKIKQKELLVVQDNKSILQSPTCTNTCISHDIGQNPISDNDISNTLRDLNNKKLPLKHKVNEWLEKSTRNEVNISNTAIDTAVDTAIDTVIDTAAVVEQSNEVTTAMREELTPSGTLQDKVIELEHLLAEEKEKRQMLEAKIQEIQDKSNVYNTCRTEAAYISSTPHHNVSTLYKSEFHPMKYSTPQCQVIPIPIQVTPRRPQAKSKINKVKSIISQTQCIGCQANTLLTSRTFLPALCQDRNICHVHKNISQTILAKSMQFSTSSQTESDSTWSPDDHNDTSSDEYSSSFDNCTHTTISSIAIPHPTVPYHTDMPTTVSAIKDIPTTVSATQCNMKEPKVIGKPLQPLQNIINQQLKTNKQRVYDYRIPFKKQKTKQKERSKPLLYTESEVQYLLKGVKIYGTRWRHILNAYPFQEGRTAVSLKDKYKLLSKKN